MKFIEKITIPLAVIIASFVLAFGMVMAAGSISVAGTSAPVNNAFDDGGYPNEYPEPTPPGPQVTLKKDIDKDDFIYGNEDAEVFIVEYSDIDCPFCARVHPTLEKIVDDSDGEIAWVFRHFPLTQLHPDAARKARASECVGRLAGNDAFWQYLSGLFTGGTTNAYADYGISQSDFEGCIESQDVYDAVDEDTRRATESGGTGTPFSVIANDKQGIGISGALPEQAWLQSVASLNL